MEDGEACPRGGEEVSLPEAQALLDEALKRALIKANLAQRKILLRMHFLMEQQEKALSEKNHDLVVQLAKEVTDLVGKLTASAGSNP